MVHPGNYTETSMQTDTGKDEETIEVPIGKQTDSPAPPKKIHNATWMMHNANEQPAVLSICHDDIQQSANEVTSKEGYEVLCSCSWKQTVAPTIYVPGTPATFTFQDPKEKAIELTADTGMHWIDQHAARAPTYQFEPAFQAMAALHSGERFDDVDIVMNRSSIQALHKWIKNISHQAFHLDLDIVGSTLFLGRNLMKPKATSTPNSFGRSFEDFFTAEDPELEEAEGHHRVLKYDFGGLKMVVRVEADAYISNTEYDIEAPVILHPACAVEDTTDLGIAHAGPEVSTVIAKGTLVPQPLLIELKSNEDSMPKEQMWLGRTMNCALGKMKKPEAKDDEGKEGKVPTRQLARLLVKSMDQAMMEEWEAKSQDSLRKLAWLLQQLQVMVKKKTVDGSAVLVSLSKDGPLTVYATKGKVGALPQEIIRAFWGA